jgi:hypothetical protein
MRLRAPLEVLQSLRKEGAIRLLSRGRDAAWERVDRWRSRAGHLAPDVEMDVLLRDGAVVMEPVGSRWDRLLAELRRLAAERGLTERDVELALAETRGHEI